MRSFIAIPVSPSGQISKVLSELGLWRRQGLKPVEPENMHLTLKFLGEIDPGRVPEIVEAIERAIEDHSPFRVQFKGMGAFPNENYIKVVWVGIDSDGLGPLASDVIDAMAGLGFERSKFSAHLTLARVKGPKPRERIQEMIADNRDRDLGRLDVDSIYLMKSTLTPAGPIYDEVSRIELAGTSSLSVQE